MSTKWKISGSESFTRCEARASARVQSGAGKMFLCLPAFWVQKIEFELQQVGFECPHLSIFHRSRHLPIFLLQTAKNNH